MNPSPVSSPAGLSPGKLWAFRLAALVIVCVVTGAVAEIILQKRAGVIAKSDHLEPGMIQYDPGLGWRLTAGWTGGHTHHDFAARYAINPLGFRGDTPARAKEPGEKLTVVVGDSFTFGLGVNDDATFVGRLQANAASGTRFLNAAVPGYSTDQQALLIEQSVTPLKPDRILLVVYLANDLFDNLLPFPLQVGSAKPYFVPTPTGLELRNSPVPMERKPPGFPGLTEAVWGDVPATWPLRTRWEQRSELLRIATSAWIKPGSYEADFAARFAPNLKLFEAIYDRIAARCAQSNIELKVALLGGRSLVEAPGSVSAQYQKVLGDGISVMLRRKQVDPIDISARMAARGGSPAKAFFFPNDGHLTAEGHKVVAEILREGLGAPR